MNTTPAFSGRRRTPVRSTPAPSRRAVRSAVDLIDRLAVKAERRIRTRRRTREKQTSDTRTAAPSITHGSSLHASKIRRHVRRSLQRPPVRAAPDGVGRDEPGPGRLARGDLPARLLEPVADQVGFRRHAAGVGREHPRHVVLAQVRDQQLAAQERRVADHDVGRRPLRLGAVRRQDRVTALDRVQRLQDRVARDSAKPLRRIHWISPIHTDTRASSAA